MSCLRVQAPGPVASSWRLQVCRGRQGCWVGGDEGALVYDLNGRCTSLSLPLPGSPSLGGWGRDGSLGLGFIPGSQEARARVGRPASYLMGPLLFSVLTFQDGMDPRMKEDKGVRRE